MVLLSDRDTNSFVCGVVKVDITVSYFEKVVFRRVLHILNVYFDFKVLTETMAASILIHFHFCSAKWAISLVFRTHISVYGAGAVCSGIVKRHNVGQSMLIINYRNRQHTTLELYVGSCGELSGGRRGVLS